ncbi:hypothetical protein QQZ08_005392 [Neonectria magnoliae]|uniref:Apple domain-containing protein n=1 Tax=Neonectria magnoliae TaxID=2732573 RepID=A0ABR1I5C0_9HYPO
MFSVKSFFVLAALAATHVAAGPCAASTTITATEPETFSTTASSTASTTSTPVTYVLKNPLPTDLGFTCGERYLAANFNYLVISTGFVASLDVCLNSCVDRDDCLTFGFTPRAVGEPICSLFGATAEELDLSADPAGDETYVIDCFEVVGSGASPTITSEVP